MSKIKGWLQIFVAFSKCMNLISSNTTCKFKSTGDLVIVFAFSDWIDFDNVETKFFKSNLINQGNLYLTYDRQKCNNMCQFDSTGRFCRNVWAF